MHILLSTEAGSQADNQGSIGNAGSGVPLGQDRIHEHIGAESPADGAFRVYHHRYPAFFPGAGNPFLSNHSLGQKPIDLHLAFIYGFAERNRSADGQGLGDFREANTEAGPGQAMGHSGGHFPSTFDQYNQVFQSVGFRIHKESKNKE
jgi:hypothetical protein